MPAWLETLLTPGLALAAVYLAVPLAMIWASVVVVWIYDRREETRDVTHSQDHGAERLPARTWGPRV